MAALLYALAPLSSWHDGRTALEHERSPLAPFDGDEDAPALRLVVLATTWATEEMIHTHNVRRLARLRHEHVPRERRGRCVLYAINAIDNDVDAWRARWTREAERAGIEPLVHASERDVRRGFESAPGWHSVA